MIEFAKPTLGKEEIRAVTSVINSDWLAAGPEVEAFEQEFADYVGVKYAIFTNSCTSALKMAYKYYKEQGSNHYCLLTGDNTFCATYASAEEMGLARTFSMASNSNAVKVVVHYGGEKVDTGCDIEDSAHRIEPNDPLVGKIRCYSFYATKNMTTGSGGMFVTNDKEIYEKAKLYWRDGLSTSTHERNTKGYEYEVLTFAGGYDGNDIGAAMGRVQLQKLPAFTKRRNEIRDAYNRAFNLTWRGNHLYPYGKDRKLISYLKEKGISAGYFYPPDGFVCLPIYPLLTDEEVEYIIKTVKDWK
jgi:dTDP-4-amino-4,6-dideoxygalactose transaminase